MFLPDGPEALGQAPVTGHCLSVNPGFPKLILFPLREQEYAKVSLAMNIDCKHFYPECG